MRMKEVGGRCGGETWTHGEKEVQSLQRDPSTTAVVASSTDDDGAGGEKTIQALASWVRWRSKEVEPKKAAVVDGSRRLSHQSCWNWLEDFRP
jgi:hypothetical protein